MCRSLACRSPSVFCIEDLGMCIGRKRRRASSSCRKMFLIYVSKNDLIIESEAYHLEQWYLLGK